jgi:hypothetical protein
MLDSNFVRLRRFAAPDAAGDAVRSQEVSAITGTGQARQKLSTLRATTRRTHATRDAVSWPARNRRASFLIPGTNTFASCRNTRSPLESHLAAGCALTRRAVRQPAKATPEEMVSSTAPARVVRPHGTTTATAIADRPGATGKLIDQCFRRRRKPHGSAPGRGRIRTVTHETKSRRPCAVFQRPPTAWPT